MANGVNGINGMLSKIVQIIVLLTFLTGIMIWICRATPSVLTEQVAADIGDIKPQVVQNTTHIAEMRTELKYIAKMSDKIYRTVKQ